MLIFFSLLAISFLLLAALAWFGSNYLLARREPDEADSPANYGLAAETAVFQSGDGLTLRGWYIPVENSDKTIIVCSGANGSLDADMPVAPWLHAAGFNVLLFDWRAHGQSEGQVVTLGCDERYDLISAVEFARSKGARRVGVLGFSLGGSVALATAAVYQEIDVVAADSPFIHIVSAVAGGLIERQVGPGPAYLLARLFLITACLRTRRNLFIIDPVRWIGQVAPRPLLVVFGDRDVITPAAEVNLLLMRAGEPKDVWRVPEAAHRTVQAQRPEEYQRRITDFFTKYL